MLFAIIIYKDLTFNPFLFIRHNLSFIKGSYNVVIEMRPFHPDDNGRYSPSSGGLFMQ